jgi:hypothetical protein
VKPWLASYRREFTLTKPPNDWTKLAQVIPYAESMAKETGIQHIVYCLNGRSHYAVCEKDKLPPDTVKIGKLVIRKDHQLRYHVMYTTQDRR